MSENKTSARASDEELALNAAAGSEKAFEELSHRYSGLIGYFAASVLPRKKETSLTKDDFFQYGLLGLFAAAKSYTEGGASFRTYASKCVRNAVYSAARKLRVQLDSECASLDEAQETAAVSAEDEFLISESARCIRGIIQTQLTPVERQALELFTEGRSYREIAQITGKSVKSVDGSIQRAKKKIAAAFKGETDKRS